MTATPKTKTKLCWNCEGTVSVFDENCPYCAVYVGPAEQMEEEPHAPPYQMLEKEGEAEIPSSPYEGVAAEEVQPIPEVSKGGVPEVLVPAVLLLSGSVFFVFSLVLYLFAQDGILTLQWKSSLWYLYLIISLPMLIVGWRFLSRLGDESPAEEEANRVE